MSNKKSTKIKETMLKKIHFLCLSCGLETFNKEPLSRCSCGSESILQHKSKLDCFDIDSCKEFQKHIRLIDLGILLSDIIAVDVSIKKII